MFRLGYIPAVSFLLLTGFVNWRFAEITAGENTESFIFYLAIGLSAALFSAAGFDVIARNISRGAKGRATVAFLLLTLCLGYDTLAGYGLSTYEHNRTEARVNDARREVSKLELELKRLGSNIEAYAGTPALAEARAMASSLVTPQQCADVLGPNKLSAIAANRIREACADTKSASVIVAKAETLERLKAQRAELETGLAKAQKAAGTITTDPRVALIGEDGAIWLPVIVVTLGALAGLFTVAPVHTAKSVEKRPETPIKGLEQAKPAVIDAELPGFEDDVPPDTDILDRLNGLFSETKLPAKIRVDAKARSISGTQRPIAAFVGVPVSNLNKRLKKLKEAGVLALDTSNNMTTITLQ